MVGGSVGKRGAEMERGSGGGLVGRRKGQWRGISLRALGGKTQFTKLRLTFPED